MTFEEYLAREQTSAIKHEYVAGEIFAMTAGTVRHAVISANLLRHLHAAAKRRGCKVLIADVMLRAAEDRAYYPDVIVACGAAAEVELIIEAPSLVAEVTSPSTRATDRREKLEAYKKMPSLRCYLVVDQRRKHVLAYRRAADGEWEREELDDGVIALDFLDAQLTLDQIYEDVTLPPLAVKEAVPWGVGDEYAEFDEE